MKIHGIFGIDDLDGIPEYNYGDDDYEDDEDDEDDEDCDLYDYLGP